ncbi:MAG: flagellin N-terminal helical domain-containing protein [Planctomycetota bacterium]
MGLEFRNVLDVAYGAYVVKGAYSGVNGLTGAPERDEAVAIIRELLDGDIAAIYTSAHEASTAVSMVQTLTSAAGTIRGKLTAMEELAKKASSPDYSRVKVEEMQKEFQGLAAEINQTAKGTEYNFNKLFSGEGKSISIQVDNETKIDIFASDLRFSAEGLNLATSAGGALAEVKKAAKMLNEYLGYLDRQAGRLADVTAVLDSELEAALDVDLSEFSPDLVKQVTAYAARDSAEDGSRLLEAQANVDPERALRLLSEGS